MQNTESSMASFSALHGAVCGKMQKTARPAGHNVMSPIDKHSNVNTITTYHHHDHRTGSSDRVLNNCILSEVTMLLERVFQITAGHKCPPAIWIPQQISNTYHCK